MRNVTTKPTSAEDTDGHAGGWATMKRVAPYLWPEGETWIKVRVVAALLFLLAAKLVSITMPFMYKQAVDALVGKDPSAATMLGLGAVGLTVAYGLARFGSVAFGEIPRLGVRAGRPTRACASWRWRRSPIFTACRCAITSPAKPAGLSA